MGVIGHDGTTQSRGGWLVREGALDSTDLRSLSHKP
jgi:hypothetical protein